MQKYKKGSNSQKIKEFYFFQVLFPVVAKNLVMS